MKKKISLLLAIIMIAVLLLPAAQATVWAQPVVEYTNTGIYHQFATDNYVMRVYEDGFRYGFYRADGSAIAAEHSESGVRFGPVNNPADVATTVYTGLSGDIASFTVVNTRGEMANIDVVFFEQYLNIQIRPMENEERPEGLSMELPGMAGFAGTGAMMDLAADLLLYADEDTDEKEIPAAEPKTIDEPVITPAQTVPSESELTDIATAASEMQLFAAENDTGYLKINGNGTNVFKLVTSDETGDAYTVESLVRLDSTNTSHSVGLYAQFALWNDFLLFFIKPGDVPLLKYITPNTTGRQEKDYKSEILVNDLVMQGNTWYHLKMQVDGRDVKAWVDDVLVYDVTNDNASEAQLSGGAGLRMYNTNASFDDIKITRGDDAVLLDADFETTEGIRRWQAAVWEPVGTGYTAYHVAADGTQTLVPDVDPDENMYMRVSLTNLNDQSVKRLNIEDLPEDYVMEARVRFDNAGSNSSAGIYAHQEAWNAFPLLFMKDGYVSLKRIGGDAPTFTEITDDALVPGVWYRLKLEVSGDTLRAWVGDEMIFEGEDNTAEAAQLTGLPGLRIYHDNADFDDIIVYNTDDTSVVYYQNDFEDTTVEKLAGEMTECFTNGTGQQVTTLETESRSANPDGQLGGTRYLFKRGTVSALVTDGLTWTDYTAKARFSFENNDETTAFFVSAHMQDADNGYLFGFAFEGGKSAVIYKLENGARTLLSKVDYDYEFDTEYELSIDVNGGNITGYIDGTSVVTAADATYGEGTAGVQAVTTIARLYEFAVTSHTELFRDSFSGDLGAWQTVGECFISYDGDPRQEPEQPEPAPLYTIDARLAGGINPMYGLGDHGAWANTSGSVRDTSNVFGVNRLNAGDFTNREGGAVRWMSNFSIAPQLGFAQVLFEEADKRVAITDEHTLMGALQTEEVYGLYYFFGPMEDIYRNYRQVRNEAGYVDTKPHYEMFGLGWEAFGALGWNAFQTSVMNTVGAYLDYGYNITWAVVGSGFWKGDRYKMEQGTTTAFGIWDDEYDPAGRTDNLPNPRFPDPQELKDFFADNNIKFLLGLRVHFKLPEEYGGYHDPVYDGNFVNELLENEYFLKDHDGNMQRIMAKYPTGSGSQQIRGYTAYLDGSNPDAVAWYAEQAKLWGVDGWKEDTMVLNGQRTYNDGNWNRILQHMVEEDDSLVIMRNGAYSLTGDVLRINDANYGTSNSSFNNSPDRMIINMAQYAASGVSNVYPDIVGGTGASASNASHQKYIVRNAQMAALTPSMSLGLNVLTMGNEAYVESAFNSISWHSTYAPYIYDAALKSWETGYPYSFTPLYIAYPKATNTYNMISSAEREFEWLLGESILAAPLFGNDFLTVDSRNVWLPEGKWIEYSTGEVFYAPEGGMVLEYRYHPIDEIPAFVGGKGVLVGEDLADKGNYFVEVWPISKDGSVYNYTYIDGETTSTITNSNVGWSSATMAITDTTAGETVDFEFDSKTGAFKFDYTPGHNYELTGGDSLGVLVQATMELVEGSAELVQGKTAAVAVTSGRLDNDEAADLGGATITYATSDPNVVQVGADGTVYAVGEGVANVSASVTMTAGGVPNTVTTNTIAFQVRRTSVTLTKPVSFINEYDFEDEDLMGWSEAGSTNGYEFREINGETVLYYNNNVAADRGQLMIDERLTDFSIEADVTIPVMGAGKTVGFNLRYNAHNAVYLAGYTHDANTMNILKRQEVQPNVAWRHSSEPFTWSSGETHNMRAEIVGKTITLYLDGVEVRTVTDSGTPYADGRVGLYASGVEAYFENIKIESTIQTLPVTFEGTSFGADKVRITAGSYGDTVDTEADGSWSWTATQLHKSEQTVYLEALDVDGNTLSVDTATIIVTSNDATEPPVEPELVAIELTGQPTKTLYDIGDELSLDGVEVTAHYSNGPSAVIPLEDCDITGFDSATSGTKTVVVEYEGKSASFTVVVRDEEPQRELQTIAVTTLPDKREYLVGEELKTTGMVVTAYYSDDTEDTLSAADCVLTGFDSSSIGIKTVQVAYGGKTTTFTVEVVEAPTVPQLQSIAVTKLPDKVEYLVGEALKLGGLEVTAYYETAPAIVLNANDYVVTGFDSSSIGTKTLQVSYEDKTTTFTVEVVEEPTVPQLQFIAVTRQPVKTEYLVGEALELDGLEVTAYYDTTPAVVLNVGDYVVTGFDSSSIGTKTLQVNYRGKTATFDVMVAEPDGPEPDAELTGISITTVPTKTHYKIGEKLDLSGIVVKALYDDGSDIILKTTDFTITGFDSSTPGKKTVQVIYKGFTSTFRIEVIQDSSGSTYAILFGDKQSYTGSGNLIFKIDADIDELVGVRVAGKLLEKGKDYTVTSGSTVVTLLDSYLSTLTDGTYSAEAAFTTQTVTFTFTIARAATSDDNGTGATVTDSVATGDNRTLLYPVLAVVTVLMTGTTLIVRRKARGE